MDHKDVIAGKDISGIHGTLFKSYHADRITCVETSPVDHMAVTAGDDGSVRLFDYITQKEVFRETFSAGATCLFWMPVEWDPEGLTFAVGFENGVLRILRRTENGFDLTAVMKPHTKALTCFAFSPDGQLLVTASSDETLFFFVVQDPIQEYQVSQTRIHVTPMMDISTSFVSQPLSVLCCASTAVSLHSIFVSTAFL